MTVTAEQVSGTLTDGFTVGSLRVQHRRADVLITNATGQLRLLPLLLQRRIELSSADGGACHRAIAARSARRPVARAPHFLPATLRIDADTVRADSVDLILLNGRTLHGTNLPPRSRVLPDADPHTRWRRWTGTTCIWSPTAGCTRPSRWASMAR